MPLLHEKAGGGRMLPTIDTVSRRLYYIYQEGAAVYKVAVAKMVEVASELIARNDLTANDIDWLVPHQANRRIIDTTAERAGIPLDRAMITIHKYGNTTAAVILLCLWDYESRLKFGGKLIMSAFDGGFTWAGAYLTWSYDDSDPVSS
jgi:3-oxoacyl-[acyl-carrier-protein] synthase III